MRRYVKSLKDIVDFYNLQSGNVTSKKGKGLKILIIKANPNNSIFEEVNNFNQTSKPEIDENILLYFDL